MSSRPQSKYKGKKGFLSTKKVINHAKSLSTRTLKGISRPGPAQAAARARAGGGPAPTSGLALLPMSVRLRG